jgi:hypothetical protein
MATTYKILGQACPAAATANTMYTVPSSTSTIASSLTITNQSAANASFRLAAVKSGGSASPSQGSNVFLSYDTVIPANDSITLSMGMTLATGDFIVVQANAANVSFNLFGTEIS